MPPDGRTEGRKKTVDGAFRYARKKGKRQERERERNLCEGDDGIGGRTDKET